MPDLSSLADIELDELVKGVPAGARLRLADVGAQGWNLLAEDLPLPVAVIKTDALDHNGRWMAAFLTRAGARIAPHGKTTMSPQLFQRQLADGAWAITVATAQQLAVCRRFGFERVVLANQVVGRQAIRQVLDIAADPDFELYLLADSVAGVEALARAAAERPPGRPIKVLLEGGVEGGRTGCRNLDAAVEVARAVAAAAPHLALRGVEGFEGLIQGADAADQEAKVAAFVAFLGEIARACAAQDLFAPGPVILSAGGSSFYDLVVDGLGAVALDRDTMVLCRSGCYLTHDSALYRRAFARLRERCGAAADLGPDLDEGLRPAFQIWAYVQSRPEDGKAILTLGRRDVGSDADLPVPEVWFRPGRHNAPEAMPAGHAVTALNDQHAHMGVPADSPLGVGDMVGFGISHPCTTFDKWRLIYLVDRGYSVTDAIWTFF